MKKRKITLPGKISNGRLRFYADALKDWANQYKDERLTITLEILPKEQSKLLRAYYNNYVVPELRHAMKEAGEHLTHEQTEQRLREFAPMMHDTHYDSQTGHTTTIVKEIDDLGNSEFIEYLDWLKEFAAENFATYIEDPGN